MLQQLAGAGEGYGTAGAIRPLGPTWQVAGVRRNNSCVSTGRRSVCERDGVLHRAVRTCSSNPAYSCVPRPVPYGQST